MTTPAAGDATGLVDLLDRLLDTGAAVGGDVTLALAGVDLVHLRLRALLASVEAEERLATGRERPRSDWLPPPRRRRRRAAPALPARIDADPEALERGLAQLVLVVADILRELMERQALRRMRAGSLARDEVERLSAAFEALDDRLDRLFADIGPASSGLNGVGSLLSPRTEEEHHDADLSRIPRPQSRR